MRSWLALVTRNLAITDTHLPANRISYTFRRTSRTHTRFRASFRVLRSRARPHSHVRLGRVLHRCYPSLRTSTPMTSLRKYGRTSRNSYPTEISHPWPVSPAMCYHMHGRPCTKISIYNPYSQTRPGCASSRWDLIQSWPCSSKRSNPPSFLHSMTYKVHYSHSPSRSLFAT